MNYQKKRGLSPVIATVLLVSLALVLAVIVFLWARAFIPEAIEKQGQSIELACEQTQFNAEAYDGILAVENTGSIPIYGVEIREKRFIGDVVQAEELSQNPNLEPGQSAQVDLPGGIEQDAQIIVVPILIGKNDNDEVRSYPCDEEYGVEITVQ